MIRPYMALLLLLLWGPTSSLAAQGVKIVYQVEGMWGGEWRDVEARYFLQNHAVRIEVDVPWSPTRSSILLRPKGQKKSYVLDPNQKIFIELPAYSTSTDPATTPTKDAFKETGSKKKIAGFKCDLLRREIDKSHDEMCVSRKLISENQYAELVAADQERRTPFLPTDTKILPLEVTKRKEKTDSFSKPSYIFRMLSFQRKALPTSYFTVPKNYKRQEWHAMGLSGVSDTLQTKKPPRPVPQDAQRNIEDIKTWIRETH